jgi:integrase
VDLAGKTLTVRRTVIEVNGSSSLKAYPKTRAGYRTIPLPGWLVLALKVHMEDYSRGPNDEVFVNSLGGAPLRSNFRKQVWRPSLVRSGLLAEIEAHDDDGFRVSWNDRDGNRHSGLCENEREAVATVAQYSGSSLRFHDLRHSYATWLISSGLPVNEVARVLGHEQVTTTLNRYTHSLPDTDARNERTRGVLDDFPLTPPEE